MVDCKKVMKALKCCLSYDKCTKKDCPYWQLCDTNNPPDELLKDALELLKVQEPVKIGKRVECGDVSLGFYECGYCKNAIRKPWRYCPFCGKEVKWNDET